jgi:flagellar biosynthetic protein FliQ
MSSAALGGALLREGLALLGTVGAPLLLGLLAVGLVVGVLQAATQVNDPAVGFLPRLVAAILLCVLLGGWMMERMAGFLVHALQRMAERPF